MSAFDALTWAAAALLTVLAVLYLVLGVGLFVIGRREARDKDWR